MIMALERLDRITAFMEEQSGHLSAARGSVGTIPEGGPRGLRCAAQHA